MGDNPLVGSGILFQIKIACDTAIGQRLDSITSGQCLEPCISIVRLMAIIVPMVRSASAFW
eukprot:scaffold10802_cov57-Attheya_sp.AAC.7